MLAFLDNQLVILWKWLVHPVEYFQHVHNPRPVLVPYMTIGVRVDLADKQGTSSSNDVRRSFSAGSSGPSHPILIHLGYRCWFN